jgi:type IV secretion system protein VirB5
VLKKNPLGLYVDAIDWSKELDTSPVPQAPRPVPPPPASNPPLGSPLDPGPAESSAQSSPTMRNSR